MLRKLFSVALLFGVVSQVQAAKVWEVNDNYIKSVVVYGSGVHNILQIELKNPIATGCAVTDSSKKISYWVTTDFNLAVSSWVSSALSAQAQGKKVSIHTENTVCDPYYGRFLQGIRISEE